MYLKILVNMKITKKVIENTVSEVVGADVIPIINFLKDKKNISEFQIAEALKIEVNRTRNMLYRLHGANLVSFIRKKDKEKGWYIYYWTFNQSRIKYLIKDLKKKKIEGLKERLEREKGGNFFVCENRCIRLDFEQAVGFDFKCPECGSLMNQQNNEEIIKNIKDEIKKTEKELEKINV